MDGDTIFSALPDGEKIVEKYEYSSCCSSVRTISILTNLRLLISRRYTTCGCCTRSSYTSIALDSIERVDEIPANTQYQYFIILTLLFLVSMILLIIGATREPVLIELVILGVIGIVLSITIVVLLIILEKNVLIILRGTFGWDSLKLSKSRARQLEGQLIEMSFKTQLLYMSQLTMQYEQQIRQSAPLQQPLFAVQTQQPAFQPVESKKRNNVKKKQEKEDLVINMNNF